MHVYIKTDMTKINTITQQWEKNEPGPGFKPGSTPYRAVATTPYRAVA